ncbi:hypothetical protein Dthio_PD0412 [Desulfonatronospira thiodismutans ASO3-1]|uniref:DUF2281 domain-containing protein n=1 Tax=Desulfonatronospira thiodismutans ASO3-1 TaxID=555779 RepID=D6SU06_9BACT|nr:hypothetical protein [Desulfonatronospira thiodismutans]EFI33097.1 hypothetical protein Dthio_PD0412 [Desulfonatronospira thiodismutans ASO3-1]
MQITQRSEYEKLVLQEIKDLPESEIQKIIKMIQFLKKEVLQHDKPEDEDYLEFWDSFGSWKDERTAEEIIKDIYETRRSSSRDISL